MLYLFGGLPGVGKTTLARQLAQQQGAVYLRIDTIEQALRRMGMTEIGPHGYALAQSVAADNLRLGQAVVADMVNPWQLTRVAWRAVAEQIPVPWVEIEVICSDVAEHRRRVEARSPDLPDFRLPTWADVQQRRYEPWSPPPIVIDTAGQTPAASGAKLQQALQRYQHPG